MSNSKPDYYDEAVAYFKRFPDEIAKSWCRPSVAKGGELFAFASKTRRAETFFGCLSMIRLANTQHMHAQTPELTARIRADERIPEYVDERAVNDFEVFAEWQRILDKELEREIPVWSD